MNDDAMTTRLLQRLAELYREAGDAERSLALLLLADRLAPAQTELRLALAAAFLASGQATRALAALDQLAGQAAERPAVLRLSSQALWALGRRDEARQRLQPWLARVRQEATHA